MKITTANTDSPQGMRRLWAPLDRPSSRPSVIYCWRTVSGTWSSPASWHECPTDWPTPFRPKVKPWLGRKRCRACWREWPEKCSRSPSREKPAWPWVSRPHPWFAMPPTWGRGSRQSVNAPIDIRSLRKHDLWCCKHELFLKKTPKLVLTNMSVCIESNDIIFVLWVSYSISSLKLLVL